MPEFELTEYQLGTLIYWELCASLFGERHKAALSISMLRATTRIVSDADEKWMQSFPPEKLISREEAAEALRETSGKSRDFLSDDQFAAVDRYLSAKRALINQLSQLERTFQKELSNLLGCDVDSVSLDSVLDRYAARRAVLESRKERWQKLNPPKLSWEMQVHLNSKGLMSKPVGIGASEETERKAKREELAAQERRDMEHIRAVIMSIEDRRNRHR